MSSQYAGDPTAYPVDFTIPDDSDPPNASAFNVAIEGLGDRTANLDDRIKETRLFASALSFGSPVARGTGAGKAVYNAFDFWWYCLGGPNAGNDVIAYSQDYGYTYTALTPGGAALGSPMTDADVDTSGRIVIAGSGNSIATYSGGVAGTWTKVAVFPGTPTLPVVVYDPVNARWCAAGYDTGQRVFTTATPTAAWSSATSPLTGTQRPVLSVNKVSGRIMLLNTTGGTTVKVNTSDDGGQTWTVRADVVPGPGGLNSQSIAVTYAADDARWFLWVGSSLYVSTDNGETFTYVRALPTNPPHGAFTVVPGGAGASMLIAFVGTKAGLIYSRDLGVTWYATGWRPGLNAQVNLAAAAGSVLATGTFSGAGFVYASTAKTSNFGTVV